MIKKILKYGTVLVSGAVVGTYLEAKARHAQHRSNTDPDELWKGEETTLDCHVDMARENIVMINDVLESDMKMDYKFMEEDLRDIRTKLQHGISDASENDSETFELTLHDRQRLRLIEVKLTSTLFGQAMGRIQ